MIRSLLLAATLSVSVAAIAPVQAIASEAWAVDPVHTWAQFRVKHLGAGITVGRFDVTSGTLTWNAADPTKSAIAVTIQADSISTGAGAASTKRDDHLKGADFLSVKEFPTITFASTAIAKAEAADTWTVTGNVTLRGVTKPVTATLVKTGEGKYPAAMGGKAVMGFEATFAISRREFGITYGEGMIGDQVQFTYTTEVVK